MSIKKLFSGAEWPALAILLFAALLRLAWLDLKPPHFDEGVNGLFIDRMADTGYYEYDPANYHGPLHFYVLFLSQSLLGRSLWALRLPIVLLSVLATGLTLGFGRFIGKNAARWAALAMAVSPACVFYGRYAIHETWLLVALLMMALGLGGLWKSGSLRSLWLLVGGVVLSILTKETYAIHAGCFLLAAPALRLVEWKLPSASFPWSRQAWTWWELAQVVGLGLIVTAAFYAGFGLNWKGLHGMYQTFASWADTGQDGNGHAKEWYYWLKLMSHYEWPALLGLSGSVALLWPGSPRFLRYLAILGVGSLVAYTLIPYKTPWCVVVLLWPFLLVFGQGVDRLSRRWPRWNVLPIATALLLSANLAIGLRLNFLRYDDDSEPYVYVQTFRELNRFTKPIFDLVKRDRTAYFMGGKIILNDYHPLPWILGDFTKVGYYSDAEKVDEPDAAFIAIEKEKAAAFEPRLKQAYFREEFRLRSGQKPIVAYFSVERFAPVFPGRKPDIDPSSR